MVPEMKVPASNGESVTTPPWTIEPACLLMKVAPAPANAKTPSSPESDPIGRSVPPSGASGIHEGIVPAIVDVDIDASVDIHPRWSIVDDRVAVPLIAIRQIRSIVDSGSITDSRSIRDTRSISNTRSATHARSISRSVSSARPVSNSRSISKSWKGHRTVARAGSRRQRRSDTATTGLQRATDAQKVANIAGCRPCSAARQSVDTWAVRDVWTITRTWTSHGPTGAIRQRRALADSRATASVRAIAWHGTIDSSRTRARKASDSRSVSEIWHAGIGTHIWPRRNP